VKISVGEGVSLRKSFTTKCTVTAFSLSLSVSVSLCLSVSLSFFFKLDINWSHWEEGASVEEPTPSDYLVGMCVNDD